MNLRETAKLTGIPEQLLVRMRCRENRTLRGGPPYCRKIAKNGSVDYVYNRREVERWMRVRNCSITAADAASFLDISRFDLLKNYKSGSIEIRTKDYKGTLFIDNGKNIYIWIPLRRKRRAA